MQVTATEAKNRLGQMLDHAQREPVFIDKQGRPHSVLISAAQYHALVAAGDASAGRAPRGRGHPGREFYEKYKSWVDLQNALVERHGIPGEEFRAW
jgi:prevent-host-death family protein